MISLSIIGVLALIIQLGAYAVMGKLYYRWYQLDKICEESKRPEKTKKQQEHERDGLERDMAIIQLVAGIGLVMVLMDIVYSWYIAWITI
jgi:succinyl-CoA synthetase beta subunit